MFGAYEPIEPEEERPVVPDYDLSEPTPESHRELDANIEPAVSRPVVPAPKFSGREDDWEVPGTHQLAMPEVEPDSEPARGGLAAVLKAVSSLLPRSTPKTPGEDANEPVEPRT